MSHRHQPSLRNQPPEEACAPIVRLWLLRILQTLGGHKQWVQTIGFTNDALAQLLGLGRWLDKSVCSFDSKAVRQELRQLHQAAESQAAHTQVPSALQRNVAQLAALAHLSATDCRILEFACTIHIDPLLDEVADRLGELSSARVATSLAAILHLPLDAVRAALAPQGVLARTGLVALDRNGRGSPLVQ